MNVVDLHPEELLDREAGRVLSEAERERLDRHVARCASCRIERRLRADFRDEDAPVDDDFDVQRLLSEVLAPGAERVVPPTAPSGRRNQLVRLRTLLLVAAALLVAGVATAAGWPSIRRLVVHEPEEASKAAPVPAPAPVAAVVHVGAGGTSVAIPAPSARVASVADDRREPADLYGSSHVEEPVATTTAGRDVRPSAFAVKPPATLTASDRPAPSSSESSPRSGSVTATDPAANAPPPDGPMVLFERASAARRAGDHDGAADLYRELARQYPGSAEAHESRATLGRMLLADGDAHAAVRSFDAYLEVGGSLSEDVMADRAAALGKLGRGDEEATAWSALLSAYPGSVHAERARARLRELRAR